MKKFNKSVIIWFRCNLFLAINLKHTGNVLLALSTARLFWNRHLVGVKCWINLKAAETFKCVHIHRGIYSQIYNGHVLILYCIYNCVELDSWICVQTKLFSFYRLVFVALLTVVPISGQQLSYRLLLLFSGSNWRFKDKVVSGSYHTYPLRAYLLLSILSPLIHSTRKGRCWN